MIYTRVSTDDQGDNFSLPTQLGACRKYAEAQGMEIVAECSDVMSGSLLDRPGLTKVRQAVSMGGCDAVIVYAQDRLTRSVAHMLLLRDELRAANVAMHAVSRGQSAETPEGRLFDTIEASFAEFERLKIKERMTRGKRGKLESGRVLGNHVPPYGFIWRGQGRDKLVELHDEEAAIVRQIAAWYVDGVGVREICRRLDAGGVPTPASTRNMSVRPNRDSWSSATVYAILRSRTYLGEFVSPTYGVVVAIPAVLDATLWAAIQARLDVGRQRSRRNARRFYLLRTRLRCVCGGMLCGKLVTGNRRRYYCHASEGRGLRICEAPRTSWDADKLEALVWHWLVADVLHEGRILEGINHLHEDAAARRAVLEAERTTYQQHVDAAAAKVARMVQLYTANILTLDEVAVQKHAIDATNAAALAEIARIDAALAQAALNTRDVAGLCAYAAEIRASLADEDSDELRAEIVDLLDVAGTLVHDGGGWYLDVTARLTLDTARLTIVSTAI